MDGPSTSLRLRVRASNASSTQSFGALEALSPGATRSEVVGRHGEAWKIRVHAPPEDGQANRAVVDLLVNTLEISRARIEIHRGHASRDKSVLVHGVTNDEAERRLAAWEAT